MEYKVLSDPLLHDLVNDVNRHMANGWKLQGGISVSRAVHTGHNDELRYYQALIKG